MKAKTISSISILFVSLCGLCSCDSSSEPISDGLIHVESISLSDNEYTLYFEDSYSLTATVYPENADNKAISWSTSDKEICNVNNGTLFPYKAGTVTITATSLDNGVSSSCEVTVEDRTTRYGMRTNDSILADPYFNDGFTLRTYHQSPPGVEGNLNYNDETKSPRWVLAQWWTPFDFMDATFTDNGNIKKYENVNRSLIIDTEAGSLTMSLDASKEYEYFENTPEEEIDEKLLHRAWPHFLLEQSFPSECRLRPSDIYDEGGQIRVSFDVVINKADRIAESIASDCAQLLFYVRILNNWRDPNTTAEESGSNNTGVMWNGVPIFDTRYDYINEYHSSDSGMAGATNNLIYSLSSKDYMGSTKPETGKTYHIDVDILPTILQGFQYGVLNNLISPNIKWENLILSYMNFGWEVPGGYDVSSTISNLDIKVVY